MAGCILLAMGACCLAHRASERDYLNVATATARAIPAANVKITPAAAVAAYAATRMGEVAGTRIGTRLRSLR